MSIKNVIIEKCYPILGEPTADARGGRRSASLPADFPQLDLEEEQLEKIEEWWDAYRQGMLDRVRRILCIGLGDRGSAPSARNMTIMFALLARMLGLFPGVNISISHLAQALGIAPNHLASINTALMRAITEGYGGERHPIAVRPSLLSLAAAYPQLDWARREGDRGTYRVPFVNPKLRLDAQWELVVELARVPRVSATLDTMGEKSENCVRINIHPKSGKPCSESKTK